MNRAIVLVVHDPSNVIEEMMRGLLMEAMDTGLTAQMHMATPLNL